MPSATLGRDGPGADHQQQLREKHDADQRADRQILQEALAQLGEIDVEHHHHEQEQHRDRADIDHHQDHGEEFGAQQHEQPGRVDEGEDQEQHRMHGILRRDHHQRGRDADAGEEIEEEGVDDHAGSPSECRPIAMRALLPITNSRTSLPALSRKGGRNDERCALRRCFVLRLKTHHHHRYGASSAMFFAISRSQRSPFASSRSLS